MKRKKERERERERETPYSPPPKHKRARSLKTCLIWTEKGPALPEVLKNSTFFSFRFAQMKKNSLSLPEGREAQQSGIECGGSSVALRKPSALFFNFFHFTVTKSISPCDYHPCSSRCCGLAGLWRWQRKSAGELGQIPRLVERSDAFQKFVRVDWPSCCTSCVRAIRSIDSPCRKN